MDSFGPVCSCSKNEQILSWVQFKCSCRTIIRIKSWSFALFTKIVAHQILSSSNETKTLVITIAHINCIDLSK